MKPLRIVLNSPLLGPFLLLFFVVICIALLTFETTVKKQGVLQNNVVVATSDQIITESDPTALSKQLLSLKTFRGAERDGLLRTDTQGNLIVDLALRQWLDFHLAAQGEVELADILSLMQSQMTQLPEPGSSQALALLQQYISYLQALEHYDLEQQKRVDVAATEDMVDRTRWQQRLRQQWFSAQVINAFFAGDELLDNYMIEQLLARRSGASEDELRLLEQQLPEPIRRMREQTRSVVELNRHEQAMIQQGQSSETIHRWRVQQFGHDAANRLAATDQKQQVWNQRLTNYFNYMNSEQLQSIAPEYREELLMTYRNQHFSAQEQKRLPAAIQLLSAN